MIARNGHLAEKQAEACQEWRDGRLGTRHEEWEEGDHGGFDIPTLVIFFGAVAIVAVGFLLAGALL